MSVRTILGSLLFLFLSLPGFSSQSFDLAYESFEDRNGNGFINCLELVTFRVTLVGTSAPVGGDRGRITVPFGNPDFWNYLPGSFRLDPAFSEGCAFSIVSGNEITDGELILDYTCDPRAGNPLDDNYALTFRVTGRFFSNTSGGLGVAARNQRNSPTTEIQDDFALSNDPGQPCPPPPDLRLTKSVTSGNGSPGATLVYTLAVNNFGGSAADDVVLQENVPVHTTFSPSGSSIGWVCSPNNSAGSSCMLPLGSVPASTSLTKTFAVLIDPSLPPNPGNIGNTACVSTSSNDPVEDNCGSTSTPAGNPDLRMTKRVVSGNGDPGGTLTYHLTVANVGSRDAAGVTVQESVPDHTRFSAAGSGVGWTCSPNGNPGATCTLSLGTVAVGATLTPVFAVAVDASLPADPGNIDNTACAATTTAGDPPGNNCGSTTTPPGGSPDLRTAKSLASGSGDPGATLVYNLTVSNLGNRDAAGVQLSETVPALATFLPASSSPGWSCLPNGNAGSTCRMALGTMASGASVSRTFAAQLAATFPANPPAIDNTACSSTTTLGGPAGSNCGSVSTPPGGNPDLRTSKSVVSGNGDPGATLIYSLVVDNLGNRDAAGVQLTETVPALSTFLPGSSSPGWTCSPSNDAGSICTLALGTVAAGASERRRFAAQLAATFPAAAPSIDNTACSSTSTPGDPAGNNCGSISTPSGGNPDLSTSKLVVAGNGDPGATLVYSLIVANLGNRDAAGVQLTETVPSLSTFLPGSSSSGWSCSPSNNAGSTCILQLGTLAAGASVSHTFAVRLAATFPANPPAIDNTACSSSQANGDPAANDCGSTTTPPGGNPDLRMSKSLASGTGDPGSELVYQLEVLNAGTRDAADVELTETVPQLTSFLLASSSPGWTCAPDGNAGGSCTLLVGTVAAGSSATYTFAVQVAGSFPPNPPPIDNTACVSTSTGGDPTGNDCGSTSTPPGGHPDLRLAKSVASGTGEPGSALVYLLEVFNAGTRDAEDVQLTETVPALTSFESAGSSPGWSCTPDGNAGSSCTLPIGTVAAGSSAAYTFAVQVASAFPSSPLPIDNRACVSTTTAGDPAGNECATTSTPPGGHPDLRVLKSVASGTGEPGGVLVYQLTVMNAGNRGAVEVLLEETVPQLTSFLLVGSSAGWTCTPTGNAGSSCTFPVGELAAGGSAIYTFAVMVVDSFPPNPPLIDNTACVSTTSGGDPAGNNCGSTSTPPGGNPDLVLSKALTSGEVVPNGLLIFTLGLQNRGSREATGVVLRETVPPASEFEAASSSPGWSCEGDGNAGSACTLAVGTVAAGASSSYAFSVRLRPDFPAGTTVSNTACLEEAPGTNDPEGNHCASVVVDPPGPQTRTDLEVAIGIDGTFLQAGNPSVFTLSVSNVSEVTAEGLRVSVSLPLFGTDPTELDPACHFRSGVVIECFLSQLAGGESVSFTWKHAPLKLGSYAISAELMEATPEDVDSTPGNGIGTEDDYAEVKVSVSVGTVHEIPTLSTVGITVMALLLVVLGILLVRRGDARRTI